MSNKIILPTRFGSIEFIMHCLTIHKGINTLLTPTALEVASTFNKLKVVFASKVTVSWL